jgi:hypothetical protein
MLIASAGVLLAILAASMIRLPTTVTMELLLSDLVVELPSGAGAWFLQGLPCTEIRARHLASLDFPVNGDSAQDPPTMLRLYSTDGGGIAEASIIGPSRDGGRLHFTQGVYAPGASRVVIRSTRSKDPGLSILVTSRPAISDESSGRPVTIALPSDTPLFARHLELDGGGAPGALTSRSSTSMDPAEASIWYKPEMIALSLSLAPGDGSRPLLDLPVDLSDAEFMVPGRLDRAGNLLSALVGPARIRYAGGEPIELPIDSYLQVKPFRVFHLTRLLAIPNEQIAGGPPIYLRADFTGTASTLLFGPRGAIRDGRETAYTRIASSPFLQGVLWISAALAALSGMLSLTKLEGKRRRRR